MIKQQKNDKKTKEFHTSSSLHQQMNKKRGNKMESINENTINKKKKKKKIIKTSSSLHEMHSLQQASTIGMQTYNSNELCGYQYLPSSSPPLQPPTHYYPALSSSPYPYPYPYNYNYYNYPDFNYSSYNNSNNNNSIPPPFILPPHPLFPFKKKAPFIPPDLFF